MWGESFKKFNVAASEDFQSQNILEKENAEVKVVKPQTLQPKKMTDGTKRALRKKLDNNEIQMKQIKLENIDLFKEHVIFKNEEQFLEISSQKEIFAIKELFEKKIEGRQQS